MSKQPHAVKNFAFRWSFPRAYRMEYNHVEAPTELMAGDLKRCMEKHNITDHILQLEASREEDAPEGANYRFQGFLVSEARCRATALHKIFNTTNYKGMYIAPSHDTEACETYVMKTDTRVMGPWHSRKKKVYNGQDLPKALLAWQESVQNYVLGPIHDRTIPYGYTTREELAAKASSPSTWTFTMIHGPWGTRIARTARTLLLGTRISAPTCST